MKLPSLSATAFCASVLLSSCALWHKPEVDSKPAFRYGIRGETQAGVVQAFNQGGKTYVQFLDLQRAQPAIADGEGQRIVYETRGQYAILPGIVDSFSVATNGGRVLVFALDRPAPQAARPAVPASAPVVEQPASSPAPAPVTAAPVAPPAAVLMRTTFNFRTDQWALQSLTQAQRRELRDVATALRLVPADEIRVIGHTDSRGSLCSNLQLSLKRAEAIASELRAAGFTNVRTYGRGPLEPVADCHSMVPAERDACMRASRRVVIELAA